MTISIIERLASLDCRLPGGLEILFLAKHARSSGMPHATDGNHALYHYELRETLRGLGINLQTADDYHAVMERPSADFVIPLLNRGGFQNSEMLAPLLLERSGVPFLGASSILRGIADDKHAAKLAIAHAGVPTMAWQVYRRGNHDLLPPTFRTERLVVKPNNSSASWGLAIVDGWAQAEPKVRALQAQGHDVIVERWVPEVDIGVPVIGGADGQPVILPPLQYVHDPATCFRSYEQKRGLKGDAGDDRLEPVEDPYLRCEIERLTALAAQEFWPFDYGRFEFRYDPATGALHFMEVNLSCNLWSRKTIARAAALVGISYPRLIEAILAHSLERQGLLLAAEPSRIAA
ncbi:D-alanine--D-alanine ligase family protein [Pacificimonas sp. ICDLI1SI03]